MFELEDKKVKIVDSGIWMIVFLLFCLFFIFSGINNELIKINSNLEKLNYNIEKLINSNL